MKAFTLLMCLVVLVLYIHNIDAIDQFKANLNKAKDDTKSADKRKTGYMMYEAREAGERIDQFCAKVEKAEDGIQSVGKRGIALKNAGEKGERVDAFCAKVEKTEDEIQSAGNRNLRELQEWKDKFSGN